MSGALLVLEGVDRRVVSDGRYGSPRLLVSTRTTIAGCSKPETVSGYPSIARFGNFMG